MLLCRVRSSGRHRASYRGAVLVEAALVFPLVLFLAVGVIELGMLLSEMTTLSGATRAAARVGAMQGADPQVDYNILQAVKGEMGGSSGDLQHVVIYRADLVADPTQCLVSVAVPGCNVYNQSDFAQPNESGLNDSAWAPSTRTEGQDLGVYIDAQHHWLTGVFGSSPHAITAKVVMSLQPKVHALSTTTTTVSSGPPVGPVTIPVGITPPPTIPASGGVT